jgi:hypothetical protein
MKNIPRILEITVHPFPPGDCSPASPLDDTPRAGRYEEELTQLVRKLVQLADLHWRLGALVIDTETGDAKDTVESADLRKIARSLNSMDEIFKSVGLTVFDRSGQDFNHGLPETVITEEARAGISRDRVLRTIRPTIMWNHQMVQRGEIDIAVPAQPEPPTESTTAQKETVVNSPALAPESFEAQGPTP